MKTIAFSDKTFEILKRLKEQRKASTFENVIIDLIVEKEKIPKDLFGSLKGKSKPFSSKDRKDIWKEREL
jgi:predicted CopG family antitoxin